MSSNKDIICKFTLSCGNFGIQGETDPNIFAAFWGISMDIKIAGISGGLLLGSMLIDYTPMDLSEIAGLKPGDVPDYDSRAIDNWNVGSIKMSDLLLFSSIAIAPLKPGSIPIIFIVVNFLN